MATSSAARNAGPTGDRGQLLVVRALCDIAERAQDAVASEAKDATTADQFGAPAEWWRLHMRLLRIGVAHELRDMMGALDVGQVGALGDGIFQVVRRLTQVRDNALKKFATPVWPPATVFERSDLDVFYDHNVNHVASEFLVRVADQLALRDDEWIVRRDARGIVMAARLLELRRIALELHTGDIASLAHVDLEYTTNPYGHFVVARPPSGRGWEMVGEMLSRLRVFDRIDLDAVLPAAVRDAVEDVRRTVCALIPAGANQGVSESVSPPLVDEVPPGGRAFAIAAQESERRRTLEQARRDAESALAKEILADLKLPAAERMNDGTRFVRRVFEVLDGRHLEELLARLDASDARASSRLSTPTSGSVRRKSGKRTGAIDKANALLMKAIEDEKYPFTSKRDLARRVGCDESTIRGVEKWKEYETLRRAHEGTRTEDAADRILGASDPADPRRRGPTQHPKD